MTDTYLPSHTINTAGTVAVATDTFWLPIETAPRGVKVQLINRLSGVAAYGQYYGDPFWTHWAPLPKMPKDEA